MALDRHQIVKRITDSGVVAVVRLAEASQLAKVADAIKAGGVDAIEFTMTTPGALKIIEATADRFGDEVLLGAGTVLDSETARAAILAGAQFIVSPVTDFPSIELCLRYGKVIIPGTLTPTEILRAWQAGADLIKVFPATAVGPRYFKDVLAPLPQVKLVPTGGVGLGNAAEFIRNGAAAIAVGGELVNSRLVSEGRFDELTATAKALTEAVRGARAPQR
ncbi:MAG: bifunctional 4-hydroxy-2-oxoglutarate aldolase/2-dehydro-3-deoxy-phosphogluconate aldolase [Anaerolineae bacterium]